MDDNQDILYNIIDAQQVYDLVAKGYSFNTCSDDFDYYNPIRSPLHSACEKNNLEVVKAICESGLSNKYLNLNIYETPIIMACKNGNLEIIKYLFSKGANINNVLLTACCEGFDDIFDYVLTFNPDLNENNGNLTPLIAACNFGNISCVEKLLLNGADPNIKIRSCITPLMHTCSRGLKNTLHIIKLLIVYGGNYYEVDSDGRSIIHYSFLDGFLTNYDKKLEVLKFLVNMGCDINSQDNHGNTAFMGTLYVMPTSIKVCKIIIKTILELGANFNITNDDGKTALDMIDPFIKEIIIE